jgi:hypothetical protein
MRGDGETSLLYDARTGEFILQPDGTRIEFFDIESSANIFNANAVFPPGGMPLSNVPWRKTWTAVPFSNAFSANFSLGVIAAPNLQRDFLLNDLTILVNGGSLDRFTADLVYVHAGPDQGDAPDASAGIGHNNYNTRWADNGPSHAFVAGLHLGALVDGNDGTLWSPAANADDVDTALPDDEDGVVNPAADLVLTVGAQPTVNMRATNTTSTAATLYGWIDYNANGVFENATERASVSVPDGTNNGIVTLVFPAVPGGFTGTTYARFRLSTDSAAANATGPASDGEVEDYRATITLPDGPPADSAKNTKIASSQNGGPALADGDKFGSAVTAIGDLDGDGVNDLVVGAPVRFGVPSPGNVHVLFMNANGTVTASQRIGNGIGGGPALSSGDYFGHSVAALGDLDGDGVTDLAVGASKDDTGGYINGAVYVLFMNSNGTVKMSQKIATGVGGGPALVGSARFGAAVSSIGDLDGDGVTDLAAGASGDDTGGNYRGAVHVLFLNPNGTVKASQKIAHGVGGGPALLNLDFFGGAVANVGDLDGDGHTELAVGASGDDTNGSGRGAVHVLFLNPNGTVKNIRKIASGTSGGPALSDDDEFGRAVAAVGDLDGDGVTDLAVGAYRDDAGGSGRGAVHVLLLNSDGTVKGSQKITSGVGGGPTLANDDRFGSGVASLGDLDGDGRIDLAVGAETDDTGGDSRGAVHVLFFSAMNSPPVITSPDSVNVPENTTSVLTVTAIDANAPPQMVTFSIVGGVDQSKFSITSGGALSFVTPPNFEAPTDANGDNVYIVIVQASDGSLTTLEPIFVTVTPVNDNNPVFTSPAAATVPENTTTVTALSAVDTDLPPQTITFSIVGGADQSKFFINAGNLLRFNSPPNFEAPADANGDNIYEVIVEASDGNGLATNQRVLVTVTAFSDFGDAPDAAPGTGSGNYNTRFADNGPRHRIVNGLRIGASIDNDDGFLHNSAANADDVTSALPDDEDGVSNPAADLLLTIGAQPTVTMRVTNTTGTPATLYGWIDYNANGVFDNATERMSAAVPSGTNNGIVMLVFPTVPAGYYGATYARFRLGTDAAAVNPTGNAAAGEVEDHRATILKQSEPVADSTKTKQVFSIDEQFASSVTSIGDLDGDGIIDLAVGAPGDDPQPGAPLNSGRGALHVLFMNRDGTIRSTQKIGNNIGGGPMLAHYAAFGAGVTSLGDFDGDGVTDIAVTASGRTFSPASAVYVLFLKPDGTVKGFQKSTGGKSITSLGDLDGDGVTDIAVGDGTSSVSIIFLNSDGTAKESREINSPLPGGPSHQFGKGIASIGDVDGDGVTDLAVGAPNFTYTSGGDVVYIHFLNPDGTFKSRQSLQGGIGFGASLGAVGDLDGDGVPDLIAGTASERNVDGRAIIMLLNSNGTVKRNSTIHSERGFGASVASIGDLDGDGHTDLAAGGSLSNGTLHLFFLKPFNNPPVITSPSTASVLENTANVMTVTVRDPDVPQQTIIFSVVGGADASRFNINSGGVLSFNPPPDFEVPTDANGDNVYVVTVQASDFNGGVATQTISVTVTPVNDNRPTFVLPDVVNVPENSTTVLNLTATDADLPPQAVSFSIAGGADQAKFSVTPGGALSFKSPPDFEAPADANGDNTYVVIVQATDGSLTNLHALLVTVTNVNEIPVTLAGDYNNSGTVDAADYVMWRNALGTSTLLPNDTTPGSVTEVDYNVWRANFGRTVPPGIASVAEFAAPADGSSRDTQRKPGTFAIPVLADLNARGPATVRRPTTFHPSRSNSLAVSSVRDHALQAWLTLRNAARCPIGEADGDDQLLRNRKGEERSDTVAALDLAFAVL